MDINIRTAYENDFLKIHKFVSNCKPLESYSEHFYKIVTRYFGNCCFIAENENKILGVIIGLASQVHNKTYFMWQIGVESSLKGDGIAKILLKKAEEEVKKLGCNRIELTVDPENIPSQRFVEKNGYINVSSKEGEIVEVMGNTAVKDYYKPGRHFILFRKELE
jgi:L-2,4-diaminobutyric acid acetyltransferase